jgi:hypothetical protein
VESIKGIVESLKVTLYEWLGIFLPGLCAVESVRVVLLPIKNVVPGSPRPDSGASLFDPTSVVAYLVLAYIAGLAVQGLSALVLEKLIGRFFPSPVSEDRQAARAVANALVKGDLPEDLLVSFCLSRVDTKRSAYDRFLALRDMTRALVLISAATGIEVLAADTRRVAPNHKVWLALGCLLATAGFLERFIRYRPLPNQALFGLFLSAELTPPSKVS